MSYTIGDRFWIPDEEHAWLVGTLKEFKNSVLEFAVDAPSLGVTHTSNEKAIKKIRVNDLKGTKLEHCGSHLDENVENLVDLDELSEGAILHHVRNRFQRKVIYTNVGSILVAVNPFEQLLIYELKDIRKAHTSTMQYPHVFVTAATAYQQLSNNLKNQSVLISGESGAGKTETTKKVLTFLANVAPDSKPKADGEPGMETKILQSNPLLEALGNAKTLRNNNSSRFGKWMKVGFDTNFKIQGCEIVNYLLEKSRVVAQSKQERNYHIFYQLLNGADEELRSELFKPLLQSSPSLISLSSSSLLTESFHYLNQSECITIEHVNDSDDFLEVLEAMETLSFEPHTIRNILNLLTSILFLGNIEFVPNENNNESCRIADVSLSILSHTATLLGLDLGSFTYSLCEKQVQMGRGSIISIKLSPSQAIDGRDTVAKKLYSLLFDWIILCINKTLKTSNEAIYSIGILDIFGFEVFECNSFEQLCINYANEKLQYHFNEVIFNEELLMYQKEDISIEKVVFEDNLDCVLLIENKPYGILKLLDEECSLGTNATDLTFINKIHNEFGFLNKNHYNKYFIKNKLKPLNFSILHFAGSVEYNVQHFLEKNKDSLSVTSSEVLSNSSNLLISQLFYDKNEELKPNHGHGKNNEDEELKLNHGRGKNIKKGLKTTLGDQFRNQLIGLITTLKTTEPHFIRCVKPNHKKIGGLFDGQLALRQLRYAGLFEAIRIRKSGYAYRTIFKVFANNYQILVDGLFHQRQNNHLINDQKACEIILNEVTKNQQIERDDWHVGTTKVFLKTNHHRTILERIKVTRITTYAIRIQHAARNFIIRMKANAEMYELKKERQRLEAIRRARIDAVICIQKYWRRAMVMIMMRSMNNLIELRRVLANREINRIKELLEQIDSNSSRGADSMLLKMFQHEVKVARVMLRMIEIQESLIEEVQAAMEVCNIPMLNRLLIKGERLEMGSHPVLIQAKDELLRLHEKRRIMKQMVTFLKNEDEFSESILHTIKEAEEHGIDPEFISKVQRVYDAAGPRLKTRNKLRHMVEIVDRYGIEQGCLEVLAIRKMQPNFAESEIRAAKQMLRLLRFELELDPNSESNLYSDDELEEDVEENDLNTIAEGSGAEEQGKEEIDVNLNIDQDAYSTADIEGSGAAADEGKDVEDENSVQLRKDETVTDEDAELQPPLSLEIPCKDEKDDQMQTSVPVPNTEPMRVRTVSNISSKNVGSAPPSAPSNLPTHLWGHRVAAKPTMPKLTKEVIDICHAITEADSSAKVKAEKKKLFDRAGSTDKLYSYIRHYKWSKTLCTWKYPEVQAKSRARAKAAAMQASETDGGKQQHKKPQTMSPPGMSYTAAAPAEGEFYGLRPKDSRGNPYIIRTLHQDFDPDGGPSAALMQAALSSVELPTSVAETLANLDHLNNVDLEIKLPNGELYTKTKNRSSNDTIHRSSATPSVGSKTVTSSDTPTNNANNNVDSKKVQTKITGKHANAQTNQFDGRRSQLPKVALKQPTDVERQLHISRVNREKQIRRAEKELTIARKAVTNKAWK